MNLSHRQQKIQEKRKQTPWREFVMDICSWYPLMLYKNFEAISLYPPTDRSIPTISHQEYLQKVDSYTSHGISYDVSLSFFENYRKLFLATPFSRLYNYSGSENSDFAFSVYNSKNCYLSFTVITDCENVLYSFAIKEGCKNIYNSSQVSFQSENIYQSHAVFSSFNVFYSKFIQNSSNILCSTNLLNCKECILCDGLENQAYCFDNKAYMQEEYTRRKAGFLSEKEKFEGYFQQLNPIGKNFASKEVGDCNFVIQSHDVDSAKYCFNIEDGRNLLAVGSPNPNTSMYDAFEAGSLGNTHFYGVLNTGVRSEHIYNSEGIVTCYMVFYSRFLENCNFCLGCIGLRNKEYCILNKQYSKEARYEKVNEIFAQMDVDGTLGQFFPATMNPFYFNDTIASLTEKFNKEEVTAKGYLWRDEAIKVDIPNDATIVLTKDLGNYEGYDEQGNRTINAGILKYVIQDESGNYYRIIPMEYKFLVKHRLPLPRKHRLERMKENFRIQ